MSRWINMSFWVHRNFSEYSKTLAFFSLLTLAGCAHDPALVAIRELPQVTTPAGNKYHVVQPGETLYTIAFANQLDFLMLAANNHVKAPYVIYPGQQLNLINRPLQPIPKVPALPTPVIAQPKASQIVARAEPLEMVKTPIPEPTSQPRTALVQPKENGPKKESIKKQTAKNSQDKTLIINSGSWNWPAKGKVIVPYSMTAPVNKGIDIAGNLGEPVTAASAGEVVYAGSDLAGYGWLIILKHSGSYLSAYAHNRELFVNEGDAVQAGQKIAEIGSTGTTEPKLHFEIRKDGKPVNPLGYLPQR